MSDIGLQVGFYTQVREYAELLDKALIELKSATPSLVKSDSARQLGHLLIALGAGNESQDLPTRLLAVFLHERHRSYANDWSTLGNALLNSEVNDAIVSDLESLAWSLEQQQAVAMARIRGSDR
jgi:hypothetical protein